MKDFSLQVVPRPDCCPVSGVSGLNKVSSQGGSCNPAGCTRASVDRGGFWTGDAFTKRQRQTQFPGAQGSRCSEPERLAMRAPTSVRAPACSLGLPTVRPSERAVCKLIRSSAEEPRHLLSVPPAPADALCTAWEPWWRVPAGGDDRGCLPCRPGPDCVDQDSEMSACSRQSPFPEPSPHPKKLTNQELQDRTKLSPLTWGRLRTSGIGSTKLGSACCRRGTEVPCSREQLV